MYIPAVRFVASSPLPVLIVATWLALISSACARPAPVVDGDPVPRSPAPPDEAPARVAAAEADAALSFSLERMKRVRLATGEEVVLSDLTELDGEVVALISFDGDDIGLALDADQDLLFRTTWLDEHRITLVDIDEQSSTIDLAVARATDRPAGEPVRLRLVMDEEIPLPDGSTVRLVSHRRRGSELIVNLTYWVDGRLFAEQWAPVEDRGDTWTFRGMRFELRDYELDAWMDVTVQPLELEPIRP